MKKLIYISGIVSVNLILLGTFLKAGYYDGASIILTLGVALFCLFFIPVSLVNVYKGGDVGKKKSLYLIIFFTIFFLVTFLFFKIQHLPGERVLMIIGLLLPFLLFIPFYFSYIKKHSEENNSKNFLAVIFLLSYIAVYSAFCSLNVGYYILNSFVVMDEYEAKSNEYFKDANMATAFIKNDKLSLSYNKSADLLVEFINDLKRKLVVTYERGVYNEETSLLDIADRDDVSIPTNIFFSEEQNGSKLKNLLNDFKNDCLKYTNDDDLKNKINQLLDTSDKTEFGDINVSWEEKHFYNNTLASVYYTLTNIENNVRIIEWQFLIKSNKY